MYIKTKQPAGGGSSSSLGGQISPMVTDLGLKSIIYRIDEHSLNCVTLAYTKKIKASAPNLSLKVIEHNLRVIEPDLRYRISISKLEAGHD